MFSLKHVILQGYSVTGQHKFPSLEWFCWGYVYMLVSFVSLS